MNKFKIVTIVIGIGLVFLMLPHKAKAAAGATSIHSVQCGSETVTITFVDVFQESTGVSVLNIPVSIENAPPSGSYTFTTRVRDASGNTASDSHWYADRSEHSTTVASPSEFIRDDQICAEGSACPPIYRFPIETATDSGGYKSGYSYVLEISSTSGTCSPQRLIATVQAAPVLTCGGVNQVTLSEAYTAANGTIHMGITGCLKDDTSSIQISDRYEAIRASGSSGVCHNMDKNMENKEYFLHLKDLSDSEVAALGETGLAVAATIGASEDPSLPRHYRVTRTREGNFTVDIQLTLNTNNNDVKSNLETSTCSNIYLTTLCFSGGATCNQRQDILGLTRFHGTNSFKGCTDIEDETERAKCEACLLVDPADPNSEPSGAIWTEIGCVDPSPAGLITRFFQIGLGIMGGIAILRFIQIAFIYQSGNQEKIQEARSMIISLIGGVVFLIASIVILRFIGVNVLGLPQGFLD